jgi:membrane protein implicated in regulation of membrane protease activity
VTDTTLTIDEAIDQCETYWKATAVPKTAVDDMVVELHHHLHEAQNEGRSIESVVGVDLGVFAEVWASVHRPLLDGMPVFNQSPNDANRTEILKTTAFFGFVVFLFAIATFFGQEEGNMDDIEIWQWGWSILAVAFIVGEVLTAGFFVLPFAVGAGIAAALAWLNVGVGWQWASFLVISIIGLYYMRRFAPENLVGHDSGAHRYRNQAGQITEAIDSDTGLGRVRVATEDWRCISDEALEVGTKVRILEVVGTRLKVTAV